MRAHIRTALGGIVALGALTLWGCGGGGGSDFAPLAEAPVTTEAERQLGPGLLSPAETLASVQSLTAAEMPPETSAGASVDDSDLPPSI
jgi:hypothetical protein